MRPNPRRAFTLIELLVVVGIMGILSGLVLAAVQRVREAAARLKCANNLRQLGLATTQYHDQRESFPAGMEFQGNHLFSSWLTKLLPYIQHDALWAATQEAYRQSSNPFRNPPHIGLATPIPVFACPADQRAAQVQFAPRDNFSVALTSYLGVQGKDLVTKDGILYRDSRVRIADITDGTSATLLAGERPPSSDYQFGWWYAGVGLRGTGSADIVLGVEEQNPLPITSGSCPPGTYTFGPGNINDQCDMFHFWSLHPGGGNFLFADGSVRFVTYSAAPIMPALASRSGGETVEQP